MLQTIQERLTAAGLVLPSTWVSDIQEWGKNVALYREYAEGEGQRRVIDLLIHYYQTGDLRDFDRYSIAWVDTTRGASTSSTVSSRSMATRWD